MASAHRYKLVNGLNGAPGTVSFETCTTPTKYLRHKWFVLHEEANTGSTIFKNDASFKEVVSNEPGYFSYETTNHFLKGWFIRHILFQLVISPDVLIFHKDDQLFKKVIA